MSESATLPQPAQLPSPVVNRTPRWGRRIELLTIGLVLVFAAESASFIARNTDVWRHLAAGRLLARGEYHFGTDPFSFATSGQYWANHSWLYDLGLYTVFHAAGGTLVAALKAFFVVATAIAMLAAARGRGPQWAASLCVLLGVLELGPQVLVQPVAMSYPLLALCLLCLLKGGKWLRIVPFAIVLWVNVDAWFFLGPVLVGLFWVGHRLSSQAPGARDHEPGTRYTEWPVWLFPACLVATLVSPHHVFAWKLPQAISPALWSSSLSSDPRFADLFASPWHWRTLGSSGGYDLSAWAFFLLLGLGLISFALNRTALRSWRSLVWVVFAGLAAWQVRLTPFFAVVGAVIVALNLREVLPAERFIRPGRALAFVSSIALVVIGYFGWESGFHTRDRGIAWGVHSDPTLVRVAEGIASWKEEANHPTGRVYNTHPAQGDYLAWFAPGEKCYLDSRLELFTSIAAKYETLSRAAGLLPNPDGKRLDEALLTPKSESALDLYDPNFYRTSAALRQMQTEATSWDIIRIDGAAILFAPKGTTPAGLRFNPEEAAFNPHSADSIPPAGNGPATLLEPDPWRAFERHTGRIGSWEADAARVYSDPSTKVPPLLAIRAARTGVEIDPRDSIAWLMLGGAYQRQGSAPGKPSAFAALTPLMVLRQIQTTTALVQAVLADPESIEAQQQLADTFLLNHSLDLGLRHLMEFVRLFSRNGPRPGEPQDLFDERLSKLLDLQDRVEAMVMDAENLYAIRTDTLSGDPLARARIADELGLHQKAIDVLVGSHFDLYGARGLRLLADLLLRTGKVVEARALLGSKELKERPGFLGVHTIPGHPHPDGHRWSYQFPAYDWFDLTAAAAAGRYDDARAALRRIFELLKVEEESAAEPLSRSLANQLAAEVGLACSPKLPLNALNQTHVRGMIGNQLAHYRFLTVARADLVTIGCLLELERGHLDAAFELGEAALGLYASRKDTAPSLPGEPIVRKYVGEMKRFRK